MAVGIYHEYDVDKRHCLLERVWKGFLQDVRHNLPGDFVRMKAPCEPRQPIQVNLPQVEMFRLWE